MMTQQDIEKYTKDSTHHGVNQSYILKQFMAYAQTCSDPENIFRYMQQKAICTFLSSYWIFKAEYLADIGDYVGCFECVEQAKDRNGISDEDSNDLNQKQADLVNRFINDMRMYPPKGKRSNDQFNFTSNSNKKPSDKRGLKSTYQHMLPIYQSKYGQLKSQKQKQFKAKREKLPLSWLAQEFEKQEIHQKKIQEKIHENSIRLSREVKYHSMHTPAKLRDHQRLTKTMDSVEILRKKRSTNQKIRHNRTFQRYDSDDQFEEAFENSNTKMVASVPVGKSFSNLQRRVTFDMNELKKMKNSDLKGSPNVSLKSHSLKNVTNNLEESYNSEKMQESSQNFKSTPHPSHKFG